MMRVATQLEKLEKSGNLKVVRENGKNRGNVLLPAMCCHVQCDVHKVTDDFTAVRMNKMSMHVS